MRIFESHALEDSGRLCQMVKPDVDRFVEQRLVQTGPFSETDVAGHTAKEEILADLHRIEEFWDHLISRGTDEETDRFLAASETELDKRIADLQANLEIAQDIHRRGRAVLLNELCIRRRRAAGVEKASLSLMRPAQVTSAVADAHAKGQQQAAAHGAVPLRPWLAKEAIEGGSVDEGEIRLTLDHRRLLDLSKFDPDTPCRTAATTATEAVWARFEAQKVAWCQVFDEEKKQLEAKICEVREQDEADQKKHEAVVAALMAKFEAHQEAQRKEAAIGIPKQAKEQGSLRASLLGGAAAAAAATADGSHSASNGSKTKSSPPPPSDLELNQKLDLMREVFGSPFSDSTPTRQWGAMLVNQLGLNFYPTKPKRFDSSTGRSKKTALVPPRVARSIEEAFPIEHGGDDSMFLSRYMLGPDRMTPGARLEMGRSDVHFPSPPASASVSTTLHASGGSVRLR